MKKISTFFLLLSSLLSSFATTYTSGVSGNWNNSATWIPNGIPDVGDDVIIASGHTVNISNSHIANSITINHGATLTMQPLKQLTILGDLIVNGFFTMNDGNISFPTPGANFIIGPAGSFTWQPGNNTAADATLFTNGIENFSPTSTLIIKKWYNYMAVPLGSIVTGDFGNLILNSKSGNVVYEWNQNNEFSAHRILGTLTIEEGWITLDKSASISNLTIGNIVLNTTNAYLIFHSGTHPSTLTVNTSSIQNNGGAIWGLYNGNGNLSLNVAGNFSNSGNIKLIFNDGIPNVGLGNVSLTVNQSFTQTAGDFRGIYNVSSSNSGIYDMTFKSLNINGGVFFGQYGCHTAGQACKLNISGDLNLNMASPLDKFRGIGLTTLSGNTNNAVFQLTVEGNTTISGNSLAEFTTSASQAIETNNFNGNLSISGCDNNFNYGTSTAAHDVDLSVSGHTTVTGGSLNLSRLSGNITATFNSNFSQSGGTISIKRDNGTAIVYINRNFSQTAGTFYYKNSPTLVSASPVTLTVTGSFAQTGGVFSFGNDASGTGITTLNLSGSAITYGGTGTITRTSSNNNYGLINYNRTGTTSFTRSGILHTIQKTKQVVSTGTTVDVISGNFQLATYPSATTDMLVINNGGKLNMRNSQIFSPSVILTYSGLKVNSGGTLSTQNINGLFNILGTACINNIGNMNFYLDANSTIEYNGTSDQTITGLATGAATTNHKYGKLEINFNGTPDINYTALGSNVFVRTQLILTKGELNLNSNTLTIENGSSSAISRTNGYIKSELQNANNPSIVKWRFMTSGTHIFPFGANSTNYIPVTFNVLSGSGNEVSISTRATGNDNLPMPSSTLLGAVTSLILNSPTDPQTKIIDRYWNITATGITANVTVSYRGAENTLDPSYKTGTLTAKYWNGSTWVDLNGSANGITSGVGSLSVMGASIFTSWIIASNQNIPLPIQLISFTAKPIGKKVRLDWETATEKNNDYFTIERSEDGKLFTEVTIVKGAGDSNSILKYHAWDENPLSGLSYYRLKQTDFDGKFSYSNIVSVNMNSDSFSQLEIQNITPNPFVNNFEINYSAEKASDVEFELINLQGKRVFKEKMNVEGGNNSYTFENGENLPAGAYIAIVRCNGKTDTKKIIKK